jgi:hypothetical protein
MAFNGSGSWTLPAGQPVVTGTVISSTTHNTLVTDIQTSFGTVICKDGQTTVTANLPMATFKHTGVGAASATTDYARYDQVQNSAAQVLSSVAGTNTVTGSASPTPAAYVAGQVFRLIPAVTNTGATTLNVSSLGAGAVQLNGAALAGGEMRAGVPLEVYVSTTTPVFEITGNGAYVTNIPGKQGADIASPAGGTLDLDTATGDVVDVTGTNAITAITLSQGRKRLVRFTGALTLTDGASLVLPGGENIVTVAGDYALFVGYASSVVRCAFYQRGTQFPVLSRASNTLGADVALNNTGNYFDGPSINVGSVGVWFVSGSVTLIDTAGAASFDVKLWDGTTTVSATRRAVGGGSQQTSVTLAGFISAPAGNIRLSAKDLSSTSGAILFNVSGLSADSQIWAFRVS